MFRTSRLLLTAGLALGLTSAHAVMPTPSATASLIDTEGKTIGQVELTQGTNGVLLSLELQGLKPGMKAIHIHKVGDCHDHKHGFQDSSGHMNPSQRQHGLLNPEGPDAGDLTNFYVHSDGYARAEFFNKRVSLDGSQGAKLLSGKGSALVIHERADDHYNQPIGGAGARVACGVIKGN